MSQPGPLLMQEKTLLERNQVTKEHFAMPLEKAPPQSEKSADSLKWIGKAEGDVYLNIGRGQETKCISSGRNPAFWRSLDMFSGELAVTVAKEDAEALDSSYLTTIVLHPNGQWEEVYLFRL
jgi:hypothetical protein